MGPRRVKGARLPALTRVLAARTTQWTRLTDPAWYGQTSREIDVASDTALWYSHGVALPIRWVLVRDPRRTLAPS